jgi:hypothetical protein
LKGTDLLPFSSHFFNSKMDHTQIRQLTKKCVAAFRTRLQAYEAENNEYKDQGQIVEEQSARFNIWADNNGEIV